MKYNYVDIERNEFGGIYDTYKEAFNALCRSTSVEAWIEKIPQTPHEVLEIAQEEHTIPQITGEFDWPSGETEVFFHRLEGTVEEQLEELNKFMEDTNGLHNLEIMLPDGRGVIL